MVRHFNGESKSGVDMTSLTQFIPAQLFPGDIAHNDQGIAMTAAYLGAYHYSGRRRGGTAEA